jgi:hypothetical protein
MRFRVFEVLTAVVMKTSIFWDITPRSPLRVLVYLGLLQDKISFGICSFNKELFIGFSSKINLLSYLKTTAYAQRVIIAFFHYVVLSCSRNVIY